MPAVSGMLARLVAALLCLALWGGVAGAQTDPFYEKLLRDGVAAHGRGDFAGAAKLFRVAAFGMLDEPSRLVEALVRLGLAQAALDDHEAFDRTFERVIEIEELLGGYSRANLDYRLRADFEERVLRWTPAATLRASTTFGSLVRRKQLLHVEGLAPAQRLAELERLVAESPDDSAWLFMLSTAHIDEGKGREAIDAIDRLLVELPGNPTVRCLRGRAHLQADQCATAVLDVPTCDVRRLPLAELTRYLDCLMAADRWLDAASVVVSLAPEVKAQRPVSKREKSIARTLPPDSEIPLLPEFQGRESATDLLAGRPAPGTPTRVSPAQPINLDVPAQRLAELRRQQESARSIAELTAVVAAASRLEEEYPNARELSFIAGEAAYRASDWQTAADHLQRAGGPPTNRPELLFYLAVSLFELGNQNEAAQLLRKAAPHLQRTGIVERYLRSILGQDF
jgi:tetratricopeptide (TPR) repeat protein